MDVTAPQPAAPPAPAETRLTLDSGTKPTPQGDASSTPQAQPPQPPSRNAQIETRTERTERVVERPATFVGVDATVAMVLGRSS